MTTPVWLELLAPLPADLGECQRNAMSAEPFAGWEEIRLVISDPPAGLRVVFALYDGTGRPGAVSDVIARNGGSEQESAVARVEPDGRVQGTHWLTRGDAHTPRGLTEAEQSALVSLAEALRRRCPPVNR